MLRNFLSICFILSTIHSFSQTSGVGLKAGLSRSNLDFSQSGISGDTNTKNSYHAGVFFDFNLSEKFNFQTEIIFSKEGEEDIDLNFINTPFLLKYFVAGNLALIAGPQFGILVSDNLDDFENSLDNLDLKTVNLVAVVGASIETNIGLRIPIRYGWGLNNLADENYFYSRLKTKTFQIGLEYLF